MILFALSVAWACGPGFRDALLVDRVATLEELPEGSFAWEAAHLRPAPEGYWTVVDGPLTVEQEALGLTDDEARLVAQARDAATGEEAWRVGRGLPKELQLYTAGAVALREGDHEQGLAWMAEVAALPEASGWRRGSWAAFALARAQSQGMISSGPSFAEARARIRSAFADPQGLAVGSLGEEARASLQAGDVATAVDLYAQQAALGSTSGASSLLFVARELGLGAAWREHVDEPIVRDLLVAWAWTRPRELRGDLTADALLAALPSGPFDGAGSLAALAYQQGQWDLARGWAAHDDGPLAAWVEAKLALRDGDLDRAAARYADAARSFPDVPSDAPESVATRCRLRAEQGAVSLARGEYVEALSVLVAALEPHVDGFTPGWADAAWVAERVLTTGELQAFVDARALRGPAESLRPSRLRLPVDQRLRELLARRLAREGRVEDALPYFDEPELRADAEAYAEALERAERGSPAERARAWLDAAALARRGLWLLGTEGDPDGVMYSGNYRGFESFTAATRDEALRVATSAPANDRRFHYRQLAADHAEAAADVLPETSQASVVALCLAASYVADQDEDRFQALYRRWIERGPLLDDPMSFGRSCPSPDWAALSERGDEVGAPWLAFAGLVGIGLLARFAQRG